VDAPGAASVAGQVRDGALDDELPSMIEAINDRLAELKPIKTERGMALCRSVHA
jgi:hypothetical protein